MKQKLLFTFALLLTAVTGAWAESWTSGACTVTLEGTTLTVSGTGAMEDYGDVDYQPWKDYRTSITSVVVGSGVTSIGDLAFEDCTNLASVTFASDSQLSNIGLCAFQNSGLTTIEIPAKVTTINMNAFTECSSLATVTFATGSLLETIDVAAFYQCTNLTSVTLPNGLTTIGITAFSYCTNLSSIIIPASVTSIGMNAFDNCTSLATVTLNSNPFIDDFAFLNVPGTVTMNLTANSAGGAYWMTFYNKLYSFQADANTKVFKAELVGTTITLHEVENGIVDAGKAVVLKNTTDDNIVMTLTTSASSDTQTNSLSGVSDPAGDMSDGSMFVLNNGTNGVGFYKLKAGETLGVGKAYLYSASLSNFFGFEGDETTGVKELKELRSDDNSYYNFNGQRIMNPTKGLYIVNGKKVIIK
jgi:hypothetical protein